MPGGRGARRLLDVYTWEPNANSGKPLFCCKEKRVAFIHHYVDIGARQQHSDDYKRLNPQGTVPTVVHDGFVITESTPAMEYIDDAFDGPPLRPADPYRRWRMRQVMRYMDNVVCPALAMVASTRLAPPAYRAMSEEDRRRELDRIPTPERRAVWEKLMFDTTPRADVDESARRVHVAVDRFEHLLGETRYLAGADYSLADVAVMATFHGLPLQPAWRVDERRTPNLWRWLRRCHARPAIQEAFALGRGFFTRRAADVRALLDVPAAVPARAAA